MITHYDMASGEVIGNATDLASAVRAPHAAGTAALRLLSVQESTASGPTERQFHPAVIAWALKFPRGGAD